MIARSHYEGNIALDLMSQEYVPGYEAGDLVAIMAPAAPLAQDLANRIAGVVLPQRN